MFNDHNNDNMIIENSIQKNDGSNDVEEVDDDESSPFVPTEDNDFPSSEYNFYCY
jgi:hypothetical protein